MCRLLRGPSHGRPLIQARLYVFHADVGRRLLHHGVAHRYTIKCLVLHLVNEVLHDNYVGHFSLPLLVRLLVIDVVCILLLL